MKDGFNKLLASPMGLIVAIYICSGQAIAQQPLLCKGQVTHTYPDHQKSYALYYMTTHQRYPAECFPQFCPAPCPFPTSNKPKKMRIADPKEIENPLSQRETKGK